MSAPTQLLPAAADVGAFEPVAEARALAARIHLAASELEREAATPRMAAIAARLREATRELAHWADTLASRSPRSRSRGRATRGARLDRELRTLHARIAPVLAARGVRWESPETVESACALDAGDLRRCLCDLLRASTAGLERGARVATRVRMGERRVAVDISVEGARGAGAESPALDALRSELDVLGVRLAIDADAGTASLELPVEVCA